MTQDYPLPWEVRDDPNAIGIRVVSARRPGGKRGIVALFPVSLERSIQLELAKRIVDAVNRDYVIELGGPEQPGATS